MVYIENIELRAKSGACQFLRNLTHQAQKNCSKNRCEMLESRENDQADYVS